MEKEINKYPLGITPMWLHREQRYNEIKNAINRYIDAGVPIPKEWRNELETLEGWLKVGLKSPSLRGVSDTSNCCPRCKSNEISCSEDYHSFMDCNHCGITWTD